MSLYSLLFEMFTTSMYYFVINRKKEVNSKCAVSQEPEEPVSLSRPCPLLKCCFFSEASLVFPTHP